MDLFGPITPWRDWKWRRLYWLLAGSFLVGLLIGQMVPDPPAAPVGPPAEAHLTDK